MICTKLRVVLKVTGVTEDNIRYSYFYSFCYLLNSCTRINVNVRSGEENIIQFGGEIKNLVLYIKTNS